MESYHQQLLDPRTYPEACHTVSFLETHISRLYLTERHVYKFKKPLDLGFLDFTTLERRHHFCCEEVRLNRRFTPDTYLGVSTLCRDDSRVRVDGTGEVVDYAVRMRRLPEERMLGNMIRSQVHGLPEEMSRLAQHLVTIWEHAPVCRNLKDGPNADVVSRNCRENLEQTRPFIGTSLTPLAHDLACRYTEKALSAQRPLLLRREAEGHVRDGHGDLHTGNICMTDPIRVYDCIEFNRHFRVADVAADLAFLLMDLDFLGRRDLAARFLERYLDLSHDTDLDRLLPFYKFYRAWVRGKVESLLAAEAETEATVRHEAVTLAWRYFNLALGSLLGSGLYLTVGRMGVGKSSLAKALAEVTGAQRLRSDVVRKELAGLIAETPAAEPFGTGLYRAGMTRTTYDTLLDRADKELARGETVIIDASFARQVERERFLALAARRRVPVWLLHLQCPDDIALRRLDRRQAEGRDASDGRRELFAAQASIFEPLGSHENVIEIDSTANLDYNVQGVVSTALQHQGVEP